MNNFIHKTVLFMVATVASSAFAQQPAVLPGGIVNHFSSASAGLPNADIAQGSIFDIYGTGIGPAELTKLSGFPIPTILANTSVQVTVAGTTVDVYLFFVSRLQIAGVLPSNTPIGEGTLTVTLNGQRSAPAPIRVVSRSIGILSLNGAGHGQAVMQMPDGRGGNPLNSVSRSIQPRGIGVFYGTGGGAVTFDETNGAPVGDLGPEIHALVGGKEARLRYKGRAPGYVGLDQYNVEIPADVSGCYVPVAFRTGNVISNYTTISVASEGACPDPRQPPSTSGIDQVGAVRLVRGTFENPGGPDITNDIASGGFSSTDFSKVTPGPGSIFTTIGPCIVQPSQQPEQPDNSASISYLDAGPVINLTGPNGDKQIMKIEAAGVIGYSSALGGGIAIPGQPPPPPLYLVPGNYTADNGAGGADVGPFQSSLTIDDEFVWTNKNATAVVERAQGLEVIWTGAGRDSTVTIVGASSVPESAAQPETGYFFSCNVPGPTGRFTVPPEVLLTLPPSVVNNGFPTGSLSVGTFTVPAVRFNATGIDYGEFSFTATISKSLRFE